MTKKVRNYTTRKPAQAIEINGRKGVPLRMLAEEHAKRSHKAVKDWTELAENALPTFCPPAADGSPGQIQYVWLDVFEPWLESYASNAPPKVRPGRPRLVNKR
jgi:hypothetical protein